MRTMGSTPGRQGEVELAHAALCLALLCVAPAAQCADLSVEINGVDGPLRENVEATVDLYDYLDRDVSEAQIQLLFSTADEQVRSALRPYGYYHAAVRKQLQQPTADEYRAVIDVDAGPPVIVRDVHVEVAGPAADLPAVREALSRLHGWRISVAPTVCQLRRRTLRTWRCGDATVSIDR